MQSLVSVCRAAYSTKLRPMQKVIMMCGAPGVGKGTFSRMLADEFGYVKVSTGDEIRKALNNKDTSKSAIGSSTISHIKRCVSSGKLIPDELVMELVYHKIREPGSAKGVILDGFPRTIHQLNLFAHMFPIHLAINITQSHEYLMASMLGRRTCMDCGMSYSAEPFYKDGYELDVQMPEKEGVCDNCKGEVKTREDDTKDVIEERLREYHIKTLPVLKNMQSMGISVVPFEPKRGVRDYPKLQQMIVSRLGLPCYYCHLYNPEYNTTSYLN